DVGLDDGYEDVQAYEQDRDRGRQDAKRYAKHRGFFISPEADAGEQAQKDAVDQVAGENVGPETDGERKHAGGGADDFYREDERREPGYGASEIFQIVERAELANAGVVEIEKSERRAGQR